MKLCKQNMNMSKSINILDKEYVQWVKSLVERYRQSQIKAAIKVNTELLIFAPNLRAKSSTSCGKIDYHSL